MTNSDVTNLTLKGQLTGNAATFTTTSGNISSRSLTSASTTWTPTTWTTGQDYNSPNLSSVVQEIVNQGTWASGNSLAIIITGTGHRASQAYDSDPSNAAQLVVTYTVNSAPTITLPGAALSYTENASATIIDATATTTDTDSANLDTGTLTVDYSANGSVDDRLAIRNQGISAGQIGVSGANVTYGGVTIGTWTGGNGTTQLVVTYNASSTPTAAQALMRNITYANVSDSPSTAARTVRFVLTDGDGGTSAAVTKTINVAAVNDAPVNTVPVAQTTNEDTAKVFSSANGNQIFITDVDAGGANNEVTLSVTNGTLTLAGTTGLTFTVGNGTANSTMTLRGTAAAINTALNGLSYAPTANYNGSATLTLATKDSVLLSLDIDTSLKGRYNFENTGALGTDTSPAAGFPGTTSGVTAVNDATRGNVLSLAGAGYVQTTGHYGNPANVTLAAWVNLSSADAGGAEVISLGDSVVLRLDSAGRLVGSLYSAGTAWIETAYGVTLAGTGWHHVAFTMNDAGDLAALYLDGVQVGSTITTTSIGYTLGANSFIGKHGNGSDAYDFVGMIDDARVYNRALSSYEITTLAKDLSMTDTDTVAITVTPVADTPAVTPATTNEDTQSTSGLVITRNAADGAEVTYFKITGITNGSLFMNDGTTAIVNGAFITFAQGNAGLKFTPTADFNGSASFTVQASTSNVDAGLGGSTVNAAITVTAVNDAPVASGSATLAAINEDAAAPGGATVTSLFTGNFSDTKDQVAGGSSANTFSGIAISSYTVDATKGNWQYSTNSGGSWTTLASATTTTAITLDAAAGTMLRFVPAADYNGAATALSANLIESGGVITNGATIDLTGTNGGTTRISTATVTVNHIITAVNDAPVLGAIGAQSINEGAPLTFTATASDSDLPANTLTFSLANGTTGAVPLGASITTGGVFSWTPSEAQGPGTYTFDVVVSDGTSTDSETITVTVAEVNAAPVLGAIGAQSINEGAPLTFTATASDSDLPANTLTFSLANGTTGAVPLGASITTGGVFSWTPSEAQGPGTYTFDVVVSDGTSTDSETITVTVAEVNAAPVLGAIGAQSINEGAPLTFTATASDSDLPANTLTFSLANGTTGAVPLGASITTGGVFSWTPSEAQGPGTYTFDVVVSDGTSTDSETITVTVAEVNAAPVLGAIGAQSINEGAPLTFTATASDSDLPANTLTFSLANGTTGAVPLGASITTGGVFSWTPSEAQGPGTYTFDVVVSDGTSTDSETITVTVAEVNAAPVLGAIGAQSINEGAPLTFTATASDSDLPANTLTFSLANGTTGAVPLGASITTGGVFSWTPSEAQGPGTYTFDVVVSDGTSTDSETITVTVAEVNAAPVLGAIGAQSINEGAPLTFTATASDSDLPANTLTFSLANGTTGAVPLGASITTGGVFSWTPSEAQGPGTYTFDVVVSDGTSTDSETITVTVAEVNAAPVLGAIGAQSINEGAPLTFTATASDSDLPANTLTFSLANGTTGAVPLGASITTGGVFSWTPSEAQGPGTYTFDVVVSDGTSTDSETITVTVAEVNAAPVLGAIGAQSINEGAPLTFTATASDSDLPANTLTFSLANGTTGAVPLGASITTGGVFSWTPSEAQGPGTYTFDVVVSDGTSTDSETITVTVAEVNAAPVLGAIGAQSINEGAPLTFTATASDSDLPANTLTFSLANGTTGAVPLGASITTGGVFSWTPSEAQGPGTYTFDVVVSDGTSTDSETITVTVAEVNAAPVLGAIGAQSINEGAPLTFTATASDSDLPANTLTFSLANGTTGAVPLGASITTGGVFSWTPSEAQGPGTYTFDVVVSDGTSTDSETITVTVAEVNAAPVLGAIGAQSINEGAPLTFTATASDSDLPANTLTFSLANGTTGAVPLGASITTGGVFSWTPSEAQGPGTYTFDVVVSDGTSTDSETITVTVAEVNAAPVLGAIGAQSINEGAPLTFTATASDSDLPANTLTFSLANGTTGAVPLGASITTGGVFSWTPSEAQGPGTYTFDVVVSDGTGTDSETITVTVAEVNAAPVLGAIGAQSINEGAPLTFTATASDSDLPANTLTFSLANGTTGAVPLGASITTGGVFSWTPSEAQGPGTYTFDVVVSDGTGSDSETITVTVAEVNAAPVWAPSAPNASTKARL